MVTTWSRRACESCSRMSSIPDEPEGAAGVDGGGAYFWLVMVRYRSWLLLKYSGLMIGYA